MKFEKIESIKRIGVMKTSDLMVKKNHNFIANDICVHNSGWGKGLALAGIADHLHREGYVVISIADPKDEIETGYAMFSPTEPYHLNHLMTIGKEPKAKKVKLYHPFTFSLGRQDLPDINFYTIPIKSLTSKEWSLIVETEYETESIRLLKNSARDITDQTGIYGFVHYIQDMVKGKKGKREFKGNPKNFFLEASAGSLKSVSEISTYMQPFKNDYFLSPNDSPLKLNWKEILQDRENYHVFFSNFIREEKIKDFVVLSLFSQIIENRQFLKYPVVILIPEIAKLMPFRPEGHKKFLAQAMKDNYSTIRSIGRGFSSVSDTQVMSGVDEEVINRSTVVFFGEITAPKDLERIAKAVGYGQSMKNDLKEMQVRNSFFWMGREDRGAFVLFFPSHAWAEPHYNFFEMYRRHYPEKMKNYSETINFMRQTLVEEENKFRERMKRKKEAEKEEEKKKLEERKSAKPDENVEKKVNRAKKLEEKSKMDLMKLLWSFKQQNPNASLRNIARQFEIDPKTVGKYLQRYEKLISESSERSEIKSDEVDPSI